MNRRNLTAAVLAGLAGAAGIVGSAQAVNINPDGLGQVLIYPYYTTNGENATLLSVVNTTDEAKAVKVRFMEGLNTREVLDFNLYMSAYDVWTAVLFDDAGTPTMATGDTSCTVPYIYSYGNRPFGQAGGQQAFLTYALGDGGGWGIERTAEGHFEMIEMGTVVDLVGVDKNGDPFLVNGSAWAATHSGGVPHDCQQLVDAWTDAPLLADAGYWIQDPLIDMEAPSGGMFGSAAVINVGGGAMYSYDPVALNNFATTVDTFDGLHQEPGTVFPSLNSGDVYTGTVFLSDGTALTSSVFTRGVDAVSFVFMRDQLMNEYTTEAAVGAGTEWVVTFPTKHFYVYFPSSASMTPVIPFTTIWDWYPGSPLFDPPYGDEYLDLPCEVVILEGLYDREERGLVDEEGEDAPPVVSPAPPNTFQPIIPFELCYETNVIRFGREDTWGAQTEILGSSNAHNIDNVTDLGFDFGWAKLGLDDYPNDVNRNGAIDAGEAALSRWSLGGLEGLPVTGFAVQRFANSFLGDGAATLANYGGIFQHKYTRKPGSSMPTP